MSSVVVAAALSAGALMMFAGCTSNHPEVTVTYTFNGKDYEVDYILSRTDAPQTVQHFIELADAGYYDGLCVHNYAQDGLYLYTGGYTLSESGELVEKNYLEEVHRLEEEEGVTFTQSVWADAEATQPLYTVYGEFSENGVEQEYGKEFTHSSRGALVMYYTSKGNYAGDVTVKRADDGKNNDDQSYQQVKYAYNSATSLFYTFTGENNITNDAKYCVFGRAADYDGQLEDGLLAAINEYKEDLAEDASFTEELEMAVNENDYFEDVRKATDIKETFNVPVEPILIKSVVVTKY